MDVNRLKELILNSGLSKQAIADKCNISRPTLDNLLGGSDAKISTLENLADYFKVSVGYFFDENNVSQTCNENLGVMVGRDNNGSISIKDCQDKLDGALLEIKHLKGEIDGKDKLILEKERLIDVLLNYGPSKNKDLSLTVYSTKGPVKIDILQITNIIPSTGKEKEFVDKINSGSGQEYPCCVIQLGKESLSVLHDSEYVWQLITEKISLVLK